MKMTTHLIKIHVFTHTSHVTNFSPYELRTIQDAKASGACCWQQSSKATSITSWNKTESVWLRSLCSNTHLQNGTGAMARYTHSRRAATWLRADHKYFSVNKRYWFMLLKANGQGQGLIEPPMAVKGHVMGHSTYVDSEIQDTTKNTTIFRDQASKSMFVPGFMATCCYFKYLLAVPKAQKASPTVGTSENRTLESIMNSYFKPIANATMNCSTGLLSDYTGVTRYQKPLF